MDTAFHSTLPSMLGDHTIIIYLRKYLRKKEERKNIEKEESSERALY